MKAREDADKIKSIQIYTESEMIPLEDIQDSRGAGLSLILYI